jgi:hypothetical protein
LHILIRQLRWSLHPFCRAKCRQDRGNDQRNASFQLDKELSDIWPLPQSTAKSLSPRVALSGLRDWRSAKQNGTVAVMAIYELALTIGARSHCRPVRP